MNGWHPVPNLDLPALSFRTIDKQICIDSAVYREAANNGGPIKLSLFEQIEKRDGLPAALLWWELDCMAQGENYNLELVEAFA